MDLGLSGRRAVVSAASGGLGLACAAALIEEGARVAICGSDAGRIAAAAGRLGPSAIPLVHDMRSPAAAREFIDDAAEILGGVDVLVANTPGPRAGTPSSLSLQDYESSWESVCLTAVAMCQRSVELMRGAKFGRIVAITSIAVRQPIANLTLSNMARTGLTGYLKTLATEVGPLGITVNSVQPGLHDTQRVNAVYGATALATELGNVPVGRLGRPEELGRLVAYLASESAGFITGTTIPVDGGAYGGLV